MHGNGNDYVFIDARKTFTPHPERIAVLVSRRHFSVGADGLVLITESEIADCGMRIYNADGTEGATCGNALRCVAKYLYGKRKGNAVFLVETLSGVRKAEVYASGKVAVFMGKAAFLAENLPSVSVFTMPFESREYTFTAVSAGNPHAVAFVENFDFNAPRVARELQNSDFFPFGVNVEFAVASGAGLGMRVIERGSGENLCCGSGACAAACAAVRSGILPFGKIKVTCTGGEVEVTVGEDYSLILEGDAEFAFRGELYI